MSNLRRHVCDRVVGGIVGHGVSSRLAMRRLHWQYSHLRPVRSVGVSNGRHSAVDGRTFCVSAHSQTALVRHHSQQLISSSPSGAVLRGQGAALPVKSLAPCAPNGPK